jgi:hypothetical protein
MPSSVPQALAVFLRLAFPSWAFFDVAEDPPILAIRRVPAGHHHVPWVPVVVAPARRWWHVVFHPDGTRTLAAQSMVERLADALAESPTDIATDARFERVAALAAAAVPGDWHGSPWEWRIAIGDRDDDEVIRVEGDPLS